MSGTKSRIKGRIKEAAGVLTDDKRLEREGKIERKAGEIKDKTSELIDDAKERVQDVVDKVTPRDKHNG